MQGYYQAFELVYVWFNTQIDAISMHQGVVDKLVDINGGLHQLPKHPRMVEQDRHLAQVFFLEGRREKFCRKYHRVVGCS